MPLRSPRDILLARHDAVIPELDRARAAALATVAPPTPASSVLATFWREVFLSRPKAWAGLAALWLILGALHFSSRSGLPKPDSNPTTSRDALIAAWRTQRRMLAEISPVPESTPPQPLPAKPKTRARTSLAGRSSDHA